MTAVELEPLVDVVPVDADTAVLVSVVAPVTHLCPHKDEVDEGEVTISWRTGGGKTFELHSLWAYLCMKDETLISHEDFVALLEAELSEELGSPVAVAARFTTAGMAVTVGAQR